MRSCKKERQNQDERRALWRHSSGSLQFNNLSGSHKFQKPLIRFQKPLIRAYTWSRNRPGGLLAVRQPFHKVLDPVLQPVPKRKFFRIPKFKVSIAMLAKAACFQDVCIPAHSGALAACTRSSCASEHARIFSTQLEQARIAISVLLHGSLGTLFYEPGHPNKQSRMHAC